MQEPNQRLPISPHLRHDPIHTHRIAGLHVESWGPPDAPALLFLHGGPGQGSYEFTRHQAAHLSRDLRLIALDQRGVLRSDPLPPGRPLTLADLVTDCETVRTHLNIDTWAVLGHSFGGMLALQYALTHPAAVSDLIFENPAWDVGSTCRSLLAAFQAHPAAPSPAAVTIASDSRDLWALLIDTIGAFGEARDEIYTPDPAGRERVAAVLAAAPFGPEHWQRGATHLKRLTEDPEFYAPHTPGLRRLAARTLLIRGELDSVPSPEEVLAFRRARPDAGVRSFPGCGHFVHAERPSAYADLVRGFLAA
ncbi:alpha/beta fold hydrolase [Actinoplanes sp. CA-054009]